MTGRRGGYTGPACAVLVAVVGTLLIGAAPPTSAVDSAAPGPGGSGGVAAVPAAAEPASPPEAAAPKARSLTLAGQTPFARPDERLQLSFEINGPPDGLGINVAVHRAVTSRTEFTQKLAGRGLGGVEGRFARPVADLAVKETGRWVLDIGVGGPASDNAFPDPARIVPGRSGVYPTEVQLVRGATVIDRFVTPLVVIAGGLNPLTVSLVWPFDATPAHQPDGGIRPAAAKAMGSGGRLFRAARATAATDVPLTLAPTPETLRAWASLAQQEAHQPGGAPVNGISAGLTALKTASARGHQLLGSPFVPIDMAGLLEAELHGEIDAEFGRGAGDLKEVLGAQPPAPATLLTPRGLGAAGLARLRQYGFERLVLHPEALQPREQRLTPGSPFAVGGGGQPYPAAVNDPDLASLLDGDDPPALRASRFLAALSLVALEAPAESRGVVVVTPDEWDPPAALLEAVLGGLAGNPALTPATVDQYFATVAPEQRDGRTVVRDLARRRTTAPGDADEVRSLRRQMGAWAGVLGGGSDWLDAADRTILVSRAAILQSGDRGDRNSAEEYLEGAGKVLRAMSTKVRGPRGQRVTLTSRQATIPISLFNATGRPLQVRVRLDSDQLRFLDGTDRLVTLASQNTTERFRVESRSTGAFPLVITVTSPDGQMRINSGEMTIRATVVSGVGAGLTAGAGIFLAVWWGNDLRRSRLRRRGGGRRQERVAARVAARALDDAERVVA